jgi:hypothetical protein
MLDFARTGARRTFRAIAYFPTPAGWSPPCCGRRRAGPRPGADVARLRQRYAIVLGVFASGFASAQLGFGTGGARPGVRHRQPLHVPGLVFPPLGVALIAIARRSAVAGIVVDCSSSA